MAGYECTAAKAKNHRRLHLLQATRHDTACQTDYHLIKKLGITTVREGFNWSAIEKTPGVYDFGSFEQLLKIGQSEGVQQIWDLNHFDYPDHLNPFDQNFPTAFAKYGVAVVKKLRMYITGTLYLVPVNEISFFAWIGADKGWWAPYKRGRKNGFLFKQILVKAAIAVMDAIWAIDQDVRFIQVDPFMRRLATNPASRNAIRHAAEFNNFIRFEAWDMLSGKSQPDLGGDPKYLDIIGVNYYIHNQEWVISTPGTRKITHQLMDWDSPDRVSFADMLQSIYDRYQRPILISETGSYGEYRERWWRRIFQEIDEALARGLPICGVCIYPTLDRPESAGFLLPNSGVWDFLADDEGCQRVGHEPSIEIIREYQAQKTQLLHPTPLHIVVAD